ncbi:nucleotidyltransferase domain-containing protein [Candidatus Hakubella thermalkaliphila]|uniref:nucleotidyltransferase domain-containing protein n=1 Tax=Candidatus Hakubella thermalkaliphila TaxID=2754717 RepID=UPI00159313AA|nr:nucleotidyltransferase domain-containing protein [Candidatus Hakubella thermalkaliphila]
MRLEEASGLSNIDLRILNEAPLAFQGEVLRQGTEIYSSDEGKRILFETRTLDAFLDYLPHLEELRRAFLHSIAEKGIL